MERGSVRRAGNGNSQCEIQAQSPGDRGPRGQSLPESDDFLQIILQCKAIDTEKLPQLGYMTGRNSYWLANVARSLDAILTPGQCIETLVMEGFVTERTILYQYCQTSLSPTLVTLVINTHHTYHRHSSPTPTPASLVKLKE